MDYGQWTIDGSRWTIDDWPMDNKKVEGCFGPGIRGFLLSMYGEAIVHWPKTMDHCPLTTDYASQTDR